MSILSLTGIGMSLIRTASAAPKPEEKSGKKAVINPTTGNMVEVKAPRPEGKKVNINPISGVPVEDEDDSSAAPKSVEKREAEPLINPMTGRKVEADSTADPKLDAKSKKKPVEAPKPETKSKTFLINPMTGRKVEE